VIGWQNPAALWGLLLIAGPIAVHLLRRHRAERVLFPSLRFVHASQSAAVRVLRPTDLLLLLVRAAVVALAVAAVAGPIVLTSARMSRWTAHVARAVIVDASESMRDAATATASSEAALAESTSATYAQRVDARDLVAAIPGAASWLTTTPPSRKEIVVISDFQRGAIEPGAAREAVRALDPAIGLRFVAVGNTVQRTTFEGSPTLGGATIPGRALAIELSTDATSSVLEQTARAPAGLRLLASHAEQEASARLLEAVARAGTPAGAASEPIVIRFSGASQEFGSVEPIRSDWMLNVVTGLGQSTALGSLLAEADSTAAVRAAPPWIVVLRREDGTPLVRAARVQNELVLDVAASADTFFAAAVVREALMSRHGVARYGEREIARIDAQVATALERPAGRVRGDAWRYAEATDARWCWLAAVALLALEHWLRGNRARAAREDARAAA
jgi:aerotolerance regulator-like protein